MDTSNQQRNVVYCHQCENEWYEDEHGLICPSCSSDFTEIVEGIPPEEEEEEPAPPPLIPGNLAEFYAPDPDEDDIDNLQWEQTGPGRFRVRGTYRTDMTIGPGGQRQFEGQAQQQGGILSIVGSALQGMLGAQQAQQMLQATQGQQQQQQQQSPQQPQRDMGQQREGTRLGFDAPTSPPLRPASAPGSPPRPPFEQQRQQPGNGTFVRHGHGPGFSYTIATSANSNFRGGAAGGNLFPRNANAPQPYNNQPDQIEQMLSQIFGNIGVVPGGPGMRGGGAPPHPFHNPDGFVGGGPFIIGAGPNGQMQGGVGGPFANLFQLLGMPPGGVSGDAVYSQEALDRIITQLMEQHRTGNAPGPASEEAIKSLPTKTITVSDQADTGKAECSICMDEVPVGENVTLLPCGHWFHAECIRAWLSEHDTCPHCRQGIMPKEENAGNSASAGAGASAGQRPREPGQAPMHDMRSPEYTRPAVPGQFPFPRQDSSGPSSSGGDGGDGTRGNPFTVPESPTLNRRNSSGGEDGRRRSSGAQASGGGMLNRMRSAFGRGSSSNAGAGAGQG